MKQSEMRYSGHFLTTEELAARWKKKAATLEIWRQRKQGPDYIKLTDGSRPSILYPIEAIDAYEKIHTELLPREQADGTASK